MPGAGVAAAGVVAAGVAAAVSLPSAETWISLIAIAGCAVPLVA